MSANRLDGNQCRDLIRAEVAKEVEQFRSEYGRPPCLAAVLVGDDPASQVYVRNKERQCEKAGIASRLIRLPGTTSEEALLDQIAELNQDSGVDGILVQLPLPKQINSQLVLDAIDPLKDVDAFHPENVGLLVQGRPRYLPCTPHGIIQLLHRNQIATKGKHCVIVGRSEIVGKPMAMMLAQRDSSCGSDLANATVTICHSGTIDLAKHTREADILIAAIGQPKFITSDMVKPGAVVIDVGINRTDEGLVGDVDYDAVAPSASAITPVPGGVGPLTVAMLLYNTLNAAKTLAERASASTGN